MGNRTKFTPYHPKTILNTGKRADHWFWTRYSAYPYIGCQHGCHFCYCREEKYAPYEDPDEFAHHIKIKQNAPELLHKALSRAPVDVIFTGDYQPVERLYQLSRKMLEVCLELGFPVFILERSPLVLRDMDLLLEIHRKSSLVVAFSIISAPGSPEFKRVAKMENLAPASPRRLDAMRRLAAAGIPTGTCMMPILPGLSDSKENLKNVIRQTADHGGQFVIASGLTLANRQRTFFFNILREQFPDLVETYARLYPDGSYGARGDGWRRLGGAVRDECERAGVRDRIPRPVIAGDKKAFNKRLVERMADHTYTLELSGAANGDTRAWRKAAWAVEDLEQDIRRVHTALGRKGILSLEGMSAPVLDKIEQWITG